MIAPRPTIPSVPIMQAFLFLALFRAGQNTFEIARDRGLPEASVVRALRDARAVEAERKGAAAPAGQDATGAPS